MECSPGGHVHVHVLYLGPYVAASWWRDVAGCFVDVRACDDLPAGDAARPSPTSACDQLQRAIARVLGLLGGEKDDLTDIPLDLEDASEFQRQVWAIARAIPPGQTITYGEIGKRLGVGPERSREIGQTMGSNPVPIIVPCHRVVGSGGKMHGYSGADGIATKRRLLDLEIAAWLWAEATALGTPG